jgi:hypothetical protein
VNKDIKLLELFVKHLEHKLSVGLTPDDLVMKLADRVAELTHPQLIKDAPKDGQVIRLFTKDTGYRLAKWLKDDGYTGSPDKGDWWEVNEHGDPVVLVNDPSTHFLPIPKVSAEDLRKIYV